MIYIKEITNKVQKIAAKKGLELYSIKEKNEFGFKIIEILLDGKIDSSNIEEIHNEILDDINDDIPDGYYLEVSSVGAEKPLRNEQEVLESIGKYVHLVSDYFKGEGTVVDFKDKMITLSINDKGKDKKINIPYEKVSKIRLAIKF